MPTPTKKKKGSGKPATVYPPIAPAASRVGEPMSATAFKVSCLEVMDQVAQHGYSVVITKRGKPVAKLVPVAVEGPSMRGALKGLITITGDIVNSDPNDWPDKDDPLLDYFGTPRYNPT